MGFATDIAALSPLFWYRFDETSGTTFANEQGGSSATSSTSVSGVNLSVGQPSYLLSNDGKSVKFEAPAGTGSGSIDFPQPASQATSACTLGFILKKGALVTNTGDFSLYWESSELYEIADLKTGGNKAFLNIKTEHPTGQAGYYLQFYVNDPSSYNESGNSAAFASTRVDLTPEIAHFVVITFDRPNIKIYIDGVLDKTVTMDADLVPQISGPDISLNDDTGIDEFFFLTSAISASQITALNTYVDASASDSVYTLEDIPVTWYTDAEFTFSNIAVNWQYQNTYTLTNVPVVWNVPTAISFENIPVTWQTDHVYTLANVPVKWEPATAYTLSNVPVVWSRATAAQIAATSRTWRLSAVLDGVEIGGDILGDVDIAWEENASTILSFSFNPSAGVIDPSTWENKAIYIDDIGLLADGSQAYRYRKFTGVVSGAVFNPDNKSVALTATTDWQGRLERMSRTEIDALITDAHWSKYAGFDDTADGYQYALDRLSTRHAFMFVDAHGFMKVVDAAAKAVADIEFTDTNRFNNTLSLQRASRRSLLNRSIINFDYQYSRLRQRNLNCKIVCTESWCSILKNPIQYLTRSMVESAANSGDWKLQGAIKYVPLPAGGTYYCMNDTAGISPYAWRGEFGVDLSALCMGASWLVAKRWAQTVVETARIEIRAQDSIDAIGELGIDEDYGMVAVSDELGWESAEFSGIDERASANSIGDYVFDGTAETAATRADFEAAQKAIIAKQVAEFLSRHQQNIVSIGTVYRPDLQLGQSIRVNTPSLKATGILKRLTERLNPVTAKRSQTLGVYVSRHGGAGLAVSDPVVAAPIASSAAEQAYEPMVQGGYHVGGDEGSPNDNPEWQGYITNRAAVSISTETYVEEDAEGNALQEPVLVDLKSTRNINPDTIYNRRINLTIPEIEDQAREYSALTASISVAVAIPQDELTLSR